MYNESISISDNKWLSICKLVWKRLGTTASGFSGFGSGFSGHFASLVASIKVPPTYWDFEYFFSKIPPILKVEVGIFSDQKSFSQNG